MSKKKIIKEVPLGGKGKPESKKVVSAAGPAASPLSSSPMNVDLLEKIVQLMTAHDLNTVDVREGEKRVILKRGAVAQTVSFAQQAPAVTVPAVSTAVASVPVPAANPATDDESSLLAIKSPMVGTFYAMPSPDSKPFVNVGSTVDEETEVCTIEAMKNFMPIKAELRGTIAKILVTNGQTVEFGQKLFLVKP